MLSILRKSGARGPVRSASAVIALCALILSTLGVSPAFAHQDPSGCASAGVTIQMTVYRQDGLTPIGGGTAEDGETIVYETVISSPSGSCSFEGGSITITPPGGSATDVTPDTGIPCVGSSSGCVPEVHSKQLSYTITHSDEATTTASRRVLASTTYGGGVTHDGNPDGVGPSGTTGKSVNVVHADIHVNKTPDGAVINAGETASFTITVTNGGAGSARDVKIDDDLPSGNGLTWTENPDLAGCTIGGLHLHCDVGTLAPAASFSVTVEAVTAEANAGVLNNTASATTSSVETHGTSESGAAADNSDTGDITVNAPGLTISKTADASPINTGEQLGFTIAVGNDGPGVAKNVTISDALPGGPSIDWSISPAYAGPGTCAITGVAPSQTLSCSLGDMAVNATASVHIVSASGDDSAGTYDNTAKTKADNFHEIAADASIVVEAPSLSITKTADENVVSAGDAIGFTVAVANGGPGTAKNVTINDPLPGGPGVSWSIDTAPSVGTCSITGSAPSQTLTCALGNFAAGASASVHITSNTTAASVGNYNNIATADADNAPATTAQDSIVVQGPQLTITKIADASPVNTGDAIGFTITVGNDGPGVAKSVTLNDPLPGGTGISWSIDTAPSVGTCSISAGTLTCAFGNLAKGASVSLHITSGTGTDSAGTYSNTATAHTTNGASVDATDAIVVLAPTLTITKSADAPSVSTSQSIGFTVTVGNTGPGKAKNVTLSDPLPGGPGISWSISPAYAGPGTCAISGSAPSQTLSCSFGDFVTGATASVHITSATTDDSAGTYDNTAKTKADNAHQISASATTVVLAPSLAIVKAADQPVVSTTENIGFLVGVSNGGPGTAFDVKLSDPLPGGNGVSWSISPAYSGPGTCAVTGSAPSQTLTCSFGDMLPGATAVVHLASNTTKNSAGTYDNTATATAKINRTKSATASIIVQPPALSITKTADADTVRVGDSIGFTLTVANAGPGKAFAVELSDPLPGQTEINWAIVGYSGPGTCALTGAPPIQTLGCSFGTMASGDSISVHVVSPTTHVCQGLYDNIATVNALNDGPYDATAAINVLPEGLALTKTADAAIAHTGDTIGYTIAVHNNGPDTSYNATMTDPLPSGTGIDWSISPAYSGPGTCTIAGSAPSQTLSCAFGNLPDGADAVVHISSATTDDSIGLYTNTAKARAHNNPVLSATASIIVRGVPKPFIGQATCEATVVPGGTLIYDLSYGNTGNGAATNAILRSQLPAGVTIIDAAGGTVSGQTVSWSLGTLDPGETGSKTLKVKVTAPNGTTLVNTVQLLTNEVAKVTYDLTTLVSNAGAHTNSAAYGLDVQTAAGHVVSELGFLESFAQAPKGNDSDTHNVAGYNGPTYVQAAVFTESVSSTVTEQQSASTASARTTGVNLLAGVITADEVLGVSHAENGSAGAAVSAAGSRISNLKINDVTITDISRNLEIDVRHPLNPSIIIARVTLQEETGGVDATGAHHAVNMIHVTMIKPFAGVTTGAEIIVSHAESHAVFPATTSTCTKIAVPTPDAEGTPAPGNPIIPLIKES